MFTDYLDTAIGWVEIKATDQGIHSVHFIEEQNATAAAPNDMTDVCKQQLAEYFAGERTTFDLPFDQAGTPFQRQVWSALLSIPFGQVASYQDIAHAVNNPKAVRAVGAANGKNPIAIIVPCHRIIGSNGTLTGYAGGLERKQWLLQHEGKQLFII